jgi:hypothetical protein
MFVAQKELKVNQGGKVVVYKHGDHILNFDTWDENAKRANINLGYVIKVEEEDPVTEKKKGKSRKSRG